MTWELLMLWIDRNLGHIAAAIVIVAGLVFIAVAAVKALS